MMPFLSLSKAWDNSKLVINSGDAGSDPGRGGSGGGGGGVDAYMKEKAFLVEIM